MTVDEEKQKVRDLKQGEHIYVNMRQDGGALVHRVENVYILFEIPLYGGEPMYAGVYGARDWELDKMIEELYSWI